MSDSVPSAAAARGDAHRRDRGQGGSRGAGLGNACPRGHPLSTVCMRHRLDVTPVTIGSLAPTGPSPDPYHLVAGGTLGPEAKGVNWDSRLVPPPAVLGRPPESGRRGKGGMTLACRGWLPRARAVVDLCRVRAGHLGAIEIAEVQLRGTCWDRTGLPKRVIRPRDQKVWAVLAPRAGVSVFVPQTLLPMRTASSTRQNEEHGIRRSDQKSPSHDRLHLPSASPVGWPSSPVRRPTRALADRAPFAWREKGASVVVNGRDKDRVASTEAAFRSEGLQVVGVCGSMDTEPAVAVLTDRAIEAFGRIDLIVSTLGGAPYPLSFEAISETQLLETLRLNTWPAVALIRAAVAKGLGDDAGSVVTISSGSPHKTTSAMVSYASAKAALNAMTRTMACRSGRSRNTGERGKSWTGADHGDPLHLGSRRRSGGRIGPPPRPADRSRGHRRGCVLPSFR